MFNIISFLTLSNLIPYNNSFPILQSYITIIKQLIQNLDDAVVGFVVVVAAGVVVGTGVVSTVVVDAVVVAVGTITLRRDYRIKIRYLLYPKSHI